MRAAAAAILDGAGGSSGSGSIGTPPGAGDSRERARLSTHRDGRALARSRQRAQRAHELLERTGELPHVAGLCLKT